MNLCPCGSNKLFNACCGPYLDGTPAPTAEALMRSRYSAYTLGEFGYIAETCAGPAKKAFNRIEAELSHAATDWLGLTVEARTNGLESDCEGTVTFTFRVRQQGIVHEVRETSLFERVHGVWAYVDRLDEQKATTKPPAKLGRNDPCHCGSGKKFKKCCGA